MRVPAAYLAIGYATSEYPMAESFPNVTRTTPDSSFRSGTDWRAAAWSGVIAGLVFMMAEMLLVWLAMGMSPWAPPRMMAAMVLGKGILPPPDDFSLLAIMTAMMIHLPLSALYGLILGSLVHRLDMLKAILVGMAFGLIAIYGVNFYLVAPAVFPWFVDARNWIGVVSHAIFGVVAAAVYISMRRSDGARGVTQRSTTAA